MNRTIQFGENVPGYNIRVLNEREIRAAAGILFLATFLSLMLILFTNNFVPVKYVITIFFIDFIIRVFISPRFSPTLIIGRWIVSRQTPEYVGARQKKFAWAVGLALSATMFVFLVLVNAYSPITGITCLVCLIFLYFESVFGICLACKFYSLVFRKKAQYCPGEVCEVKAKQDIQRISAPQWLVVFFFAALLSLLISFGNGFYSKKPYDLFGLHTTANRK
ncbi:MAG TPA: DUF4395 domain-containing protein [Puia sp.]|nr:DUF4395 domain-containing protein [Puia sp.]